ncbi:hypothetical protein [Enterovibrio paralichthyis]|uniref:hypothetical protein n=1 Tax=Enterovibrio paralichthyis TaxID=2853805 RepID=UPI001C46877C|nr:hypothetical protein [Enterovibrio paralichthyis]MBV7296829.1 hypothetical protein [Enterovibrio paralichthyis]
MSHEFTELDNQPTTDEQTAFLAELNDHDAQASGEPTHAETEAAEAEQQAMSEAEAAAMAAELAPLSAQMGLFAIESAIQMFVHPRFSIPEHRRAEVIQECAPVLVKYGALVPSWLAQYEPEIRAVKAIGGLTIASVGQVRQLKAEDAAALEAEKAANDASEASHAEAA